MPAIANSPPEECPRCAGSGEIACFTRNGHYKCAGPVPDDARGCFPAKCDECNGTGEINHDCE